MAFSDYDQSLIAPLGGEAFVDKVLRSILEADKRAYHAAEGIFTDISKCDIIGDIRRNLINEAVVGTAHALGLSNAYSKPKNQRYQNPIIVSEDVKMTVSRMYGRRRLVRKSRFKDSLPIPGQLSLFGDDNRSFTIPDTREKPLVLAYYLDVRNGKPFISEIEIQLLGSNSQKVLHRIDLMEKKQPIIIEAYRDSFFEELDVKPKLNAKEGTNNA